MPLQLPNNFPAIEILRKESVFVNTSFPDDTCNNHRLRICIVNLMPMKLRTESDFLRILSNSPLNIKVDFMTMATHRSKNTPAEHMHKYYNTFSELKENHYDGMIITGAPVENINFEDVDYWTELTQIMDWAKNNIPSTLYICWGAFAGLYHHYGIPKRNTSRKLSGVYPHHILIPENPLLRGFDDEFFVPHSRFTGVSAQDICRHPELTILSESDTAGVYLIMGNNGRDIYITGHSEYAPDTLLMEYERDLNKGLNPIIPENYFKDNDATQRKPIVKWRSHANLLFSNWLNYFVLQK